MHLSYDILIRTFNSQRTISDVLLSIERLEWQPSSVVVVDSGSTDETVQICKDHKCRVYMYEGDVFNYSKALNQGLAHVSAPYLLILSSHAVILFAELTELMMKAIKQTKSKVAYINPTVSKFAITVNSINNFSGFNGISNQCALYETEIAKKYGFLEKMPTAEDAYFSLQLFKDGYTTTEICGEFFASRNFRFSLKKVRNEYVAISYYVYRDALAYKSIAHIARKAICAVIRLKYRIAIHNAILALRLIRAKWIAPSFSSKYF